MASEIKELQYRINRLRQEGQANLAAALAEGRPLTDEEKARDDALSAQIAGLEDLLARQNMALERERVTAVDIPAGRAGAGGGYDQVKPYRGFGEQLAVQRGRAGGE